MTKEMTTGEASTTERGDKYICFQKSFRDLSQKLAGANSVSDEIYSPAASVTRFETGDSINQAKQFLSFVKYDADRAEEIVEDFAKSHKPINFYSGKDIPINIGLNIGSDELLNLGPDSRVNGRSRTIAALAQRAARLESLLKPEGIPEAYATAQGQARKALNLVEKAASLAYDWRPAWGTLNVDTALNEARGALTRKKIATGVTVGALVLAGCKDAVGPTIQMPTGQGTSIATEVVPSFTPTEVVTEPTVFDLLSKDFYMKDSTSLWYKNPTSGKNVPVLVNLNTTDATFQYALEGGENTNGPEGGRETVRYVDDDHLYSFSESVLVGVSNWDHRVFTFDLRSMLWRELLGGEAVADYVDNADSSRSIMVWRKDASDRMVEIDSGYKIDSSGALIQTPDLSSK